MSNLKNINKTKKILSMLILFFCILSITLNVLGAGFDPASITPSTDSSFDSIGAQIIGAIRIIGSFFAVGVLIVLGIKYMMGSAEEKAEYKKTMIPYVIGAVFVFFAAQIAGMIFGFYHDNIS